MVNVVILKISKTSEPNAIKETKKFCRSFAVIVSSLFRYQDYVVFTDVGSTFCSLEVDDQTMMGWHHFLQGKIIKDWADVFNE